MANIAELLRAHIAEHDINPLTDDSSSWCTSIEDVRDDDDGFWIQIMAGAINFKHLDNVKKETVLTDLIRGLNQRIEVETEPGEFMTFEILAVEPARFDAFLVGLVCDYFGVPETAEVEIFSEEL